VRRLKTQRFSNSFKQQRQTNIANTPSTTTTTSKQASKKKTKMIPEIQGEQKRVYATSSS
ncbi:unnamed protein product, partial [Adineta steineri]